MGNSMSSLSPMCFNTSDVWLFPFLSISMCWAWGQITPRNHYGSSDEHEVCGEYLLGITQMNLDLCLKEDKQGFVSVGAACHSLVLCVYRQSNAWALCIKYSSFTSQIEMINITKPKSALPDYMYTSVHLCNNHSGLCNTDANYHNRNDVVEKYVNNRI